MALREASPATAAPPTLVAPPAADRPSSQPAAPVPPRVAPRLVLGLGPAVAASHDGSSFAISAQADIGVTRHVSIVPWLQFVPANRSVAAPAGTASFRPTIFGLGFAVPILPTSAVVVPRIGAGYGILWLHVAADSAVAPATTRAPEDLLAPVAYASFSLSLRMGQDVRVVADAMLGSSTNDMVINIANNATAHWGVPVASLALRGEWVVE